MQFRKTLAYPFKRRGAHINVCDHRARRSFFRMLVPMPYLVAV